MSPYWMHCIYTLSIEESLVIIKLFKHFCFKIKKVPNLRKQRQLFNSD